MPNVLRPLCTTLALGVAGCGLIARSAAQTELPKSSPFMSASAPASASASGETVEFAAVRTIGTRTEIDLYDTQGRKHHWVAVGATVEGLKVISYDARHDQVTADIGGVNKLLKLRQPKSVLAGGAPVMPAPQSMSFATPTPPPAAPALVIQPAATPVAETAANPATPTTDPAAAPAADPAKPLSVARQEEEARMLVSDLLEIGMAQRKAYEDKQKQVADPNAAPAPTAPATPAAPATPESNGPSSGT